MRRGSRGKQIPEDRCHSSRGRTVISKTHSTVVVVGKVISKNLVGGCCSRCCCSGLALQVLMSPWSRYGGWSPPSQENDAESRHRGAYPGGWIDHYAVQVYYLLGHGIEVLYQHLIDRFLVGGEMLGVFCGWFLKQVTTVGCKERKDTRGKGQWS